MLFLISEAKEGLKMEKLHVKSHDSTKCDKNINDDVSTTEISPLAANHFLSSPCNSLDNHIGFGKKLVRCTSTPSYSSLSKFSLEKNILFTSNIKLDHELREIDSEKKKLIINTHEVTQDSLYASSCDITVNESDITSSISSNRGK